MLAAVIACSLVRRRRRAPWEDAATRVRGARCGRRGAHGADCRASVSRLNEVDLPEVMEMMEEVRRFVDTHLVRRTPGAP